MHFIGHLLSVLIVQPIFNLLVFITAILPGHNFGLSIIIFTVIVRLLMWPLVKKQLHHAKAMRELQPELKRIKKAAAGDRHKESAMVMELYKEREINPFSSLGIILIQFPIFIALYLSVRKIALDPQVVVNDSYSWLHSLGWMKELAANIHKFDGSLFGLIDLTKKPVGAGSTNIFGLFIAASAGIVQYFQSRQLMPQPEDNKRLRDIIGQASQGKQADQAEVSAAVGRGTLIFIPFMIFIFGLSFPVALPLYWLVNSAVAIYQQTIILREDVVEAESSADGPIEGEIVSSPKHKKKHKVKKNARRRRR